MNKWSYDEDTSPWVWRLALHDDIPEMTDLADLTARREVEHLFTIDRDYYAYNLDVALAQQRHYLAIEQIICARDRATGDLLAYAWLARGNKPPFSQDEVAEARFIHVDLDLPARTRIKLIAQILDHWTRWCRACEIPVLVSTTIREQQTAFMRLHAQLGFTVRGSLAYKRIV